MLSLGRINQLTYNKTTNTISKTNLTNPNIIETEYYNIQYLLSIDIPIPKLISYNDNTIEMEYIEQTKNLENPINPLEMLGKLHKHQNTLFGWEKDMYIANVRVPSFLTTKWKDCFQVRLFYLTEFLLEKEIIDYETYYNIKKIEDLLGEILEPYEIIPNLLHGDANPNNFLIRKNEVFIIDPCCFYGDPLYDIVSYEYWTNRKNYKEISNREILYYLFILLTVISIEPSRQRLKTLEKYLKELFSRFEKKFPINIVGISQINPYNKIVVQCGSYNPIHKNHINNLLVIKNYFNQIDGKSDDILFIFALASQERIRKKCKNGLSYNKRFTILKTLLENNKEIQNELNNIAIDTSGLYKEELIENLTNVFKLPIYICCGSDNIEYYSDFLNYRNKPEKILCLLRNKYRQILEKDKISNEKIVIIDIKEKTMSSTKIRDSNYSDLDLLYPETIGFLTN